MSTGPKILVAEDDPLTREAVAACLLADGFTVATASDGGEALNLWRRERPALLCLDIMMPACDGYEVCRKVRAADSSVPILFLSAKNDEIDVVLGLELGANDFIRKPFGKRELLARVRAALRRPAPDETQPVFSLGPVRVFPDELRAERADGLSVSLTARETAILALLREQAGRVVHRDTFLDRCWGIDYYPESRTLDQHIAQLRRKIEPDPAVPALIETVRGVGYRHRPEAVRSPCRDRP